MLKLILSIFLVLLSFNVISEEGHDDHKEHNEHTEKEKHDDHGEEGEHAEHEEKLDGFKLNAASVKTFDLKLINYVAQKTILPKKAIYKGLNEVNIYRFRAGLYKRIDFKILTQTKSDFHISSPDLATGDQIVINGIGFLRMAEIAASGGLSDSHSH